MIAKQSNLPCSWGKFHTFWETIYSECTITFCSQPPQSTSNGIWLNTSILLPECYQCGPKEVSASLFWFGALLLRINDTNEVMAFRSIAPPLLAEGPIRFLRCWGLSPSGPPTKPFGNEKIVLLTASAEVQTVNLSAQKKTKCVKLTQQVCQNGCLQFWHTSTRAKMKMCQINTNTFSFVK